MTTDSRFHDPAFLLEQDERLRALARRLVRDAAAADDVVQESWMRAMRGTPEFGSRIGGWLAGVVRRVAIGKHHEDAARARRERGSEPPQSPLSTEDLLAREAARRAVVDAVMQLPEPARMVIALRYFDDRSARAIAAQLGVPVETVRTRIKRALEQLRRDLDRQHGGDGRAWYAVLAPIVAVKQAATSAFVVTAVAALVLGTIGVVTWRASDSAGARNEPLAPLVARVEAPTPTTGASEAAAGPADETADRVAIDAAPTVTDASDVSSRVVDDTGAPVANARVTFMLQTFPEWGVSKQEHGTTTTASDGTFAFAAVPLLGGKNDSSTRDLVLIEHENFVTHEEALTKRVGATITLPIPRRLEGVVFDGATHTALASVPVALLKNGEFGGRREVLAETTTDGAGRYSFRALAESLAIVRVTAPDRQAVLAQTKVESAPVTRLDVTTPVTRDVILEVRSFPSDQPKAGIEIRSTEPEFETGPVRLGVTDEQGRYVAVGVPVDAWECVAVDPRTFLALRIAVPMGTANAASPPFVIDMPEPWTVRGRLVEADGAPFAGTVKLDRNHMENGEDWFAFARTLRGVVPSSLGHKSPSMTTRDDGSFELSDGLSGQRSNPIVASRGKGKSEHMVATIESPTPTSVHDIGTIVVEQTAVLAVRVVCGPSPIAGATIVARHGTTELTWTTGQDGTVEHQGIAPGPWTLVASMPGLGTSEPVVVDVADDARTQSGINFASRPEDFVFTRGRVLDSDGTPFTKPAFLVARQAFGTNGGIEVRPPNYARSKVGLREYHVPVDVDGNFELKTPKVFIEDLRFIFVNTLQVSVATARPGSSNVIVRVPATAAFRMRFVDANGAPIVKPLAFEWKDVDTFRWVPTEWGFQPSAAGIVEVNWPTGALTIRTRRWTPHGVQPPPAIDVDVDVRANDDATAPRIVVP